MTKYCVGLDYTIKEAIECVDANKERVVLVLDKESKVIGVLSQGDIIRALSAGKTLYTRVEAIIRPSFLYMNDRNMDEAYRFFKKMRITLMPIVDEEFKLKDIIRVDDIYNYLEER